MLEDHIITNNHEYKKDTSNIKFSLNKNDKHLNYFLNMIILG